MKNQIAAFVATALMASMAFAQNTSTTKMPKRDDSSNQGIRVSLLKPMLQMEVKAKFGDRSASDKGNVNDTLGFAVGYAKLPVQAIGWTANMAYLELKNGGGTLNMLRADGNVAYAFSNILHAKGGLNLSKFTSKDAEKLNPSIGLQVSMGVQANKYVGFDFGYTQMSQNGTVSGIDYTLKESGFEVGMNGTF